MSKRVALGGDRLGSGKKMDVTLHGYERSTHDLGYIWRSTMASGTLVPFMNEVALPGDTFDIKLDCDIKTHPTLGPLFGSYKVQLDVFQAPIRLYNSLLHNNMLGIGKDMSRVKLPQIKLTALPITDNTIDPDNSQINPSCLLKYLGISGVGVTETTSQERAFNAVAFLAYWEIYKNYYANKQEENGAVLRTPASTLVQTIDEILINGTNIQLAPIESSIYAFKSDTFVIDFTGTSPNPEDVYINTLEYGRISLAILVNNWVNEGSRLVGNYNNPTYGNITVINWSYRNSFDINNNMPQVALFSLQNIDMMRQALLAFNSQTSPFVVNDTALVPYNWVLGTDNNIPNALASQEGLALKTYQSDLFNNWLSTEWIDGTNGINDITAISTATGSFTLDTLNLSQKVYNMLNRIAVSGGSYNDWLGAVYDHDNYRLPESPIYHGSLIKEVVFQEVVSNTESGEGQPLGTLAGKGTMGKKHKGGEIYIRVDEPSYIMGIVSLTPRVDYSQGNKWDVNLETMDDLHKPALDEIGFQDLIIEQMAWWDTRYDAISNVWRQHAAGKQPAWINYMTNVNRVYGNFAIANNEMFMTLNRRYEYDGTTIGDLTTYIDPSKFNFIFAETARDAQNFWTQIAVDITARRKMSAKVMPNL